MAPTIKAQVKAIKFSCTKCEQHIEAPVEGEGSTIECPFCREELTIPKHGKENFRADCPRCGQKLLVPMESAGTKIDCPTCTHDFKIPLPPPPKQKLKLKLPHIPKPPKWVFYAATAAVLVFLLCAAVGAFWFWSRSPKYSLMKVTKAIEQHDFATFQKHVDIDSVTTRLIDDMMMIGILESEEEEAGATALGAGLVQLMKPRLVDEAKKQLCRFVEVGNFGDTNKMLGIFDEMKKSGIYLGIVREKKDGKIAVLGLGFTNQLECLSHTLEIKMRNMGGYWQVAELSNITELARKLKQEEQIRVARKNAPIISKINNLIRVSFLRKETGSDGDSFGEKVGIQLMVTNTGSVQVTGYCALIKARDALGNKIKDLRLRSDNPIAPGETGTSTWKFDINPFIESDVALKKCTITPGDVTFVMVKTENGPDLVMEE